MNFRIHYVRQGGSDLKEYTKEINSSYERMYKHELTFNHYMLTSSTKVIWWSNIIYTQTTMLKL